MRRQRLIITIRVFLLVSALSVDANGYERPTHEKISGIAFEQSVLNKGYLDQELNLSATISLQMDGVTKTLKEWIAEGSIREDDDARSVNHFYDPFNDRPLTVGIPIGFKAPDWAFDQGPFVRAEAFRFSWTDARRAFLDALTSPTLNGRKEALALTFRTLGNVIHVIQDMGVPEHTRNDPHLGHPLIQGIAGAPSLFEKHIDDIRNTLDYGGYPSPVFNTFRGFWTTGDGRGLAEFTNRSFISQGTNFTAAVDGNTGRNNFGNSYPSPQLSLTRRFDVDVADPKAPRCLAAAGLSGKVTFFGNEAIDRLTGGPPIQNMFLTTYTLFDSALSRKGQPGIFSINFCTVEAAATILLRRTVGYSAGLLDYFFRGKLDVDLVEDPIDPSQLQLIGTNGSSDPLNDGTLSLFADTPAGARVPAASSIPVTGVARGQNLFPQPFTFQAPEDAERFVAVYQGTLGQEVRDPSRNFPGGVIGKVLGGVRVEEIFKDGPLWKLRTPKGVFSLTTESGPLTVAQYEVVKWGDTDSALIARTRLSDPQPAVAVFSVPRQSGSAELATPPGATDVVLAPGKRVQFPATTLLTTVDFTNTVVYRQHVVRVEAATTELWVPAPPPNPDPNSIGSYHTSGTTFSGFTPELAYEQTIPLSQTFPVTLDLAHNSNIGTVFDPYHWSLQDLTVDASGRVLGLVRVSLREPQVAPATVPVFRLNGQTGAPEQFTTTTFRAFFPLEQMTRLLWALVDLEQGTVVASTATPKVAINYRVVNETSDFNRRAWVHSTKTFVEGPTPGTQNNGWHLVERNSRPLGTVTEVTLPPDFEQSLTVDGWLRDDLRQAMIARGLYNFQPVNQPRGLESYVFCDAKGVCSSLVINQPIGRVPDPGQLLQARRTAAAGGSQRLVFLAIRFLLDPFADTGDLLVWDPDLSRAQFIGAGLGLGFHDLGAATGSAALVSSLFRTGGQGTTLFRLDPTQAPTFFPNVDLTRSYTLIEPSYLYNTADLKFHRLQPSLETTALPAKLAVVTGNPIGDYHAIRLP